MTIRATGKRCVGSEPGDIGEYLARYTEDSYKADMFRLATWTCGGLTFGVEADNDEGVARRTCDVCAAEHFVYDSAEYWDEATPEHCKCIECGSHFMNVGIGLSLYETDDGVRWLYLGIRCANCGILGCFADWKIGVGPAKDVIDGI